MAAYTMELRKVVDIVGKDEVESWFKNYELSDYLTQDEINVITKHGVFSKERLARRIVQHYKMREIGFETVGLFKDRVQDKMYEIMEEKIPLIYSCAIEYDPLVNVDFTESYKAKNVGSSSVTGNTKNYNVQSGTPQGKVSKEEILNGKWATATEGDENDSTTKASSNGNDEYEKHVKGNSGVSATAQRMVQQYRDNIRAVENEVIKNLNEMFMGIY